MSEPSRPIFQPQGPDARCIINGKMFGWKNCTPTATAMGISKSSLLTKGPSGCSVRRGTGDTIGGTTLRQCADVARSMGVHVDVFAGSGVCRPSYLAAQIRKGRGAVIQGNTSALIGKPQQSTAGGVNHAVWVNEVRGGTTDMPAEALVYDPAADGRKRSYHVDKGPTWWPWKLVLKFIAALQPNAPTSSKTLGPGWVYCGIFPDTEPHFHPRYGGTKTSPFPDRTRTTLAPTNVHSKPDKARVTIVDKLPKGVVFEAWQRTLTGEVYKASSIWYGNHLGNQWVHESRLSHKGGST